MSLGARDPRSFTASSELQKHERARSQSYEPGLLVWNLLPETIVLELYASGFLGSLASILLHFTRLCELPKECGDHLLCAVG